ncbi:hypothetical protein [Actinomadura livida]|uniref:Uncharacterized protein n=1 Tax=Actinomadura livida TaxID=79909 RepID=A0ABN1DHG1_9ACTN|nr:MULTISPECIES: hypothetical protein [Actinomadura]GGU02681.1 hypothetical protein GCM10010208_28450 [Actinomadura livida]
MELSPTEAAFAHFLRTVGTAALTRFLRTVGTAAIELARDLENAPQDRGRHALDEAGLGSLQRQVAGAPGMDTEEGVSPRHIAEYLDRGDEPNIRTALAAMQKRGVAEMVPGIKPQRWRLAPQYRSTLAPVDHV